MPERDGAAVGVHVGRVVGQAQLAQHRQRLRGEGFVQLDHVERLHVQLQAPEQLARRRHRADAHDPRRHARRGGAHHPRPRHEPVLLGRAFAGHEERAGAVVHARGVARRDGPVGAEGCLELGEALERGLGPGVLVDRNR